jgi:hypothetical protein
MKPKKPLFIEIYKNAPRFTEYMNKQVWYEKNPNLPLFMVIRDPYSRFWSGCKELFSHPLPDGTPRGETDPKKLIEKGIREIKAEMPNFHFWRQITCRNKIPLPLDYIFLIDKLNAELRPKCVQYNIKFHKWFNWNKVPTDINPSDHTNDAEAIKIIKKSKIINTYYQEDIDWYNHIINTQYEKYKNI